MCVRDIESPGKILGSGQLVTVDNAADWKPLCRALVNQPLIGGQLECRAVHSIFHYRDVK